jgi:hypothetical protein
LNTCGDFMAPCLDHMYLNLGHAEDHIIFVE